MKIGYVDLPPKPVQIKCWSNDQKEEGGCYGQKVRIRLSRSSTN